MAHEDFLNAFEQTRPMLMGLAYRFLGTVYDAEDAVQDTYLKWRAADKASILNHQAWLKTVCTRRCLDIIKSVENKRIDYVGEWLPQPVQTLQEPDCASQLELASSLTTAFLLMLERLTPRERAAYLLYEIFETPYVEIAATLGINENTCRKLVSRAKAHIKRGEKRQTVPQEKQEAFIKAFKQAVSEGNELPLKSLLTRDVQLSADSGGKVPAIPKPIIGLSKVLTFITRGLTRFWANYDWVDTYINAGKGVIIKENEHIHAVVSFSFNEMGEVSHIFIVRNPEKIAQIDTNNLH